LAARGGHALSEPQLAPPTARVSGMADMRRLARKGYAAAGRATWQVRYHVRQRRALASIPAEADYHLGCGDHRMNGRVNIDVRATSATDIVADLNRPRLGSARSVVSHAFFEHLYRNDRLPHLKAIREALTPDGWLLYLGLPDFREVARLYLDGAPGVVSDRFDLYHVYRFTHGDPEHVEGWWLAQLHKSLFDHDEVQALLRDAGFGSWVLANYAFRSEPHAMNLAFYARRDRSASVPLALDALSEFAEQVNHDSLRWSEPATTASPAGV
jgi:predicted SAM-dependent methyltransferase